MQELLESGEPCLEILFARAGLSATQTRDQLIDDYNFSAEFVAKNICVIDPDAELDELKEQLQRGLHVAA